MMIFEWRKEFGFLKEGELQLPVGINYSSSMMQGGKEERKKLKRERERKIEERKREEREETVFVPSLSFLTSSSTQQVPVPFNEKICERKPDSVTIH